MRKNSGKMDQHINQASVTGVVLKQAASSGPAMCSGQGSSAFRLLLCLVLGVATLVTFWPVLHSGFINHDDGEYVVDNPHVATGLTARNVVWAFTTGHSCNWHPLTWLSHMLDVQVFGLSPAGHHAVNLLLHIANAVVLLFLLLRLTSALWPSFAVAALFALHPLHVESVAWVAERKDVLSTLFFLLTLWAYAKYVEGQRSLSERLDEAARPTENTRSAARPQNRQPQRYYRMALVLFVLGLMSKPMLVTLPFVLLLLDYWLLGRVGHTAEKIHLRAMLPLLKEKVPFLVLAMASALMTLVAQTQGHAVRAFLPASLRLENAAVSYVTYLGKTAWPTHLSIFYPHPNTRYLLPQKDPWHPASEQWPVWGILAAALLLVTVSLVLLKWRRRAPWLFTGWLWYLGTLVPVIGLVQVGMQSMADRYTYIPLIGVFIGLAWASAAWLGGRMGKPVLTAGLTAVLLACGLTAHKQATYWHDDLALFEHALAVTSNNPEAEWHVGGGRAREGKLDLAERHFKAALAADPYFFSAYSALGTLYGMQGKSEQAIEQYRTTLKMRSWDEFARVHLAELLRKLGRENEALIEYEKNLDANSDSVEGNYQLGSLLLDRGELDRAGTFLAKTLQLKPDHIDALLCVADLGMKRGELATAETALREALRLYPTNFELRIGLAGLLQQRGKEADALEQYSEAVGLQPAAPVGHFDLAMAYAGQGRATEAIKQFEEALRLKPDYSEALSQLAWLLATSPRADRRDGARALALARRALELSAGKQAGTWTALDVAYAETGQFAEAIKAAEKARDIATADGQTNATKAAEGRLRLYRNQQPFHLN